MRTGHALLGILLASLGAVAIERAAAPGTEADGGTRTWAQVSSTAQAGAAHLPQAFRAYRLDLTSVQSSLASPAGKAEIVLPLPDGQLQRFSVKPDSAMAPALAAKFPRIKTYEVASLDGAVTTGHVSVTPAGVHATLFAPEGTVKIRRFKVNGEQLHLSYLERDEPADAAGCGQIDLPSGDSNLTPGPRKGAPPVNSPATGGFVTHKTYELAIATTGEFFEAIADPQGDPEENLELVMEVVHDLIYLDVNPIYERDLAVTFELVDGTEDLYFPDKDTDPFDNSKCACDGQGSPTSLMSQSQTVISAAVPSIIARFDIGHTLGKRDENEDEDCVSSGCAAIGTVCSASNKARAASKHFDPAHPSPGFQGHEFGHQLGATHTWSSLACVQSGFGFPSGSAYEPGGGSTLMGYTVCGDENIAATPQEREYFHNFSVGQIQAYLGSKTCQDSSVSPNRKPTVDTVPNCHCCTSQLVPCVKIPPATGFVLTGEASDDGYGANDFLSYTWEQMDLAPQAYDPSVDPGPGYPLFRSFFPQEDATREFEDNGIPGEILPTSPRTMNMRLVARDNYLPAGGLTYGRLQLEVINGTPLQVTYPNGGEEIDETGLTVTWVPGASATGALGFTTHYVNILFSADGGDSWQTLTEEPTANDGSETVILPLCPTTFEGLIKVKGVGDLELSDRSDAVFRVYCPCPQQGSCTNGDVCGCNDVDTGLENCWDGSELHWCYPGTTIETTSCECDTSVGGGGIGHLQPCTGFPFIDDWGCPGVVDCPTLDSCGTCNLDDTDCTEQDLEFDACRREDFTLMSCPPGKTIHLIDCGCVGFGSCPSNGQTLRCL